MTFDNKKQQGIVLQLLNAASFTGASLDELYQFKQAVKSASIAEQFPDAKEPGSK